MTLGRLNRPSHSTGLENRGVLEKNGESNQLPVFLLCCAILCTLVYVIICFTNRGVLLRPRCSHENLISRGRLRRAPPLDRACAGGSTCRRVASEPLTRREERRAIRKGPAKEVTLTQYTGSDGRNRERFRNRMGWNLRKQSASGRVPGSTSRSGAFGASAGIPGFRIGLGHVTDSTVASRCRLQLRK